MKTRYWLLFALIANLLGCATAPPKGRADLLDFIADGKTTKEQTVLQLGEPTGKFEGEKIFTYRLAVERETKGYHPIPRTVTVIGWPRGWETQYSLVLVFDEQGVL